MSADDLHKILIPYLFASSLLVLVLAVAAWLLRLRGKRQGAFEERNRPAREDARAPAARR